MKLATVDKFFRSLLIILLGIFIFFPYIKILPISSDMQPNAVLLGIIVFFLYRFKLRKLDLILLVLLIIAFFYLALTGFTFNGFRSFFNYLSLFLITYLVFKILQTHKILFFKLMWICNYIWLLVGFVQNFFSRQFLNLLISSSRTTDNRGVTSLAPEPTFYGIICLLFLIIIWSIGTKEKSSKVLVFLNIVAIIFFAKSSMAILILLLIGSIYFLLTFRLRNLLMVILVSLPLSIYFINRFSDSRVVYLFRKLIDDPFQLLLIDASINDRFFHIYFSLKGFFDNFLIPNGFNTWIEYATFESQKMSKYVILEWFSLAGRIMSGYGSILYELGIFGLLLPIAVIYLNYRIFKHDRRMFFFLSFSVTILMMTAIPFGLSIFAAYLGILNYKHSHSKLNLS